MTPNKLLYFAAFLAAILIHPSSGAKTADRDLQAEIKAGRFTEDPENDTQIFSGGFSLRQGSLSVDGQVATIHRDPEGGFSRIVLEGEPATWREELDDGGLLDASAKLIDYDVSGELVILRGAVQIDKGGDRLSGELIHYDLNTQRLDAGGEGEGQVIMIITPRGGKR